MKRRLFIAAAAALFAVGLAAPRAAEAASLDKLNADAEAALARLVATEPVSADMIDRAAGVLVFPQITKGGLVIGAAGGEGVLRIDGEPTAAYRSTALSYGLQAGITTFGYVMVLMDQKSLDYVSESAGWEIGSGPNVTIADEGFARKFSTTSLQEGIYVFFIDQKGFFAGVGLEGTKITRVSE